MYSFTSSATTYAAALDAFEAETPAGGNLSNDTNFHVGDIACIDYNAGADSITLLYVGAADNAGPSAADGSDWKDISVTAEGIMGLDTNTGDQIDVNGTGSTAQVKFIDVKTAAVADNGTALATGDQIHDFVTGLDVTLVGDVTGTAKVGSSITTALSADTVNKVEINTSNAGTAGQVLTVSSDGTAIEWGANGQVNKLTDTFTASSSGAIALAGTALAGSGGLVTVQVYEVTSGNLSQIIPDSIEINTATAGAETVTITVGRAVSGSITAYRYVITG